MRALFVLLAMSFTLAACTTYNTQPVPTATTTTYSTPVAATRTVSTSSTSY
jgi:hypothetical protein